MLVSTKHVLQSESGSFYIDDDGILFGFSPSESNPILEEKIKEPCAYDGYVYKKSIRHLIIPKGVKGFADDVIRGITVLDQLQLPEGLMSIGNTICDGMSHGCVFAKCELPEVLIPESIKELGFFAFGSSNIDYLRIPSGIKSPYLRQFKDSHIGILCLPKEWKDVFSLKGSSLMSDGIENLFGSNWQETHGYLRFDAIIDKLEFA